MSIVTSVLRAGTNSHETTSEEANAVYTDFIAEGVVGTITNTSGVAPATGGFAVNAQGTPAMAVDVSSGIAYVTGTPSTQNSQTFRIKNSATEVVTISSNSSGSTKYDWVYINLDATKLNAPAVGGDDAATLVTSRSTSASTDDGTPPTYGYTLAVITVANGATSISDGSISDSRVETIAVKDGSVTNAKLSTTAGELGGAWSSFTPTLQFSTLVNGTLVGYKHVVGKTVQGYLEYTVGSSDTVANGHSFTAPVNASSRVYTNNGVIGTGLLLDSSSGVNYPLVMIMNGSATRMRPEAVNASATYATVSVVSPTVPITIAVGDRFVLKFEYEAA